MKIPVLGLPFDALTLDEAADRADVLLLAGAGGMIATVNPEILLRCRRDKEYSSAVRRADLILADGIGVVLASRILGTPLPERVTGADLTQRLLSRLAERGGRVFLYGARPGVAQRAAARLETAFPGLAVCGTENGYEAADSSVIQKVTQGQADLLLLGLGAPRQEKFMAQNRERLSAVMIGVGGLLDVLSGDIPRAPESWRRGGMEWLYRLLREPRRFFRVVRLPCVLLLAVLERSKTGPRRVPSK